jgi:hypothetical protein
VLKRWRLAVWCVIVGLGFGRPALAVNHLIVIDEVLGSWQGDDSIQFVELKLLAAGQRSLSSSGGRGSTDLVFFDATGAPAAARVVTFTRDLDQAQAGARVLVATQALAALTGVTPDLILPTGFLVPLAGRVCYRVNDPQDPNQNTGLIDCVAYGKYGGDTGRSGAATPLTPVNRSLQRVNTTGTTLNDFGTVLQPTPQNNAGVGVQLLTLCGDGLISRGEECDGEALDGKTCASQGFASGKLVCTQCHLDTSKCSFCGNDAINPGEECDGSDLGGRTCARLGFTGGTLACSDDGKCELSTAGCDATFFVPGGGPRGPECFGAWRITNAAQRPGSDGRASLRQSCKSGDAGCDADVAPGTCTFSLALCLDRDDARLAKGTTACKRPPVERVQLVKPAAADANAAALLAAIAALGPSSLDAGTVTFAPALDGTERCTETVPVTVATRGTKPGKLVLKLATTAAGGRPVDRDALKLVCKP